MVDSSVSLSNTSVLVNDIELSFKYASQLSAKIRIILTTGIGGNPFSLYLKFKEQFDILYCLSSDHKNMRDTDLNNEIVLWRDKPGLTANDMTHGLKLFDKYKTQLFSVQLLRYQ